MAKASSDDPFQTEWRGGETLNVVIRKTAERARELLEGLWEAIDQDGEYEGMGAVDYLAVLPLGVVWEMGEPFAVVLGTGGPHVEITGGGRSLRYTLTVDWGGEKETIHGDAIDRTGAYFRDMYENMEWRTR